MSRGGGFHRGWGGWGWGLPLAGLGLGLGYYGYPYYSSYYSVPALFGTGRTGGPRSGSLSYIPLKPGCTARRVPAWITAMAPRQAEHDTLPATVVRTETIIRVVMRRRAETCRRRK